MTEGKSGWTIETLREHLLALREDDKTAIAAALAAADRAVIKAEGAAEKRFEGLNELRGVVTDVMATLVPRVEFAAEIASLKKDITQIVAKQDRTEGQGAGKSEGWHVVVVSASMVFGAIGVIATIWSLFHGSS